MNSDNPTEAARSGFCTGTTKLLMEVLQKGLEAPPVRLFKNKHKNGA